MPAAYRPVRSRRDRFPGKGLVLGWALPMAGGGLAPDGLMLRGRQHECAVLDRLLEGARVGRSGVLVLRGRAGIGKTALLEYAIGSAADLRVVRAVGVGNKVDVAFEAAQPLILPL